MNNRLSGAVLVIGLVSLIASGGNLMAQNRANPPVKSMTGPRPLDRTIIKTVAAYLQQLHLSRHQLDDEISERAFKQYLQSIDPSKLYFLQSDVDSLMANEDRMDDFVLEGDMQFAIDTYKLFLRRLDERVEMAHKQIDAEHDFSIDEQMGIDRDVLTYPATNAEANDRVRRQIKYSLLVLENGRLQAEKDKQEGKDRSEELKVLTPDPTEDPVARLHRRYRTIHKRWSQLDADELLDMYLSAVTSSFDPHSDYFSRDALENFQIEMRLNLQGIGATLSSEDGYTKLMSIVPNGAADKDGRLQIGDKIIQVGQGEDGKLVDVVDMKLDDVVQQIRGPAGTVVRLGVIPNGGGDMQVLTITRAKIELADSAARGEVIEYGQRPDGEAMKFGYIDLPSFYMDMEAARNNRKGASTTEDVSRILTDFRRQNVDAVVLDLSRNGGGSLSEAINLTGLFIDRGPVVQVKSPRGEVEIYEDTASGTSWDGPLVVLTSKESASASEILAGAIQDYRRGIIIGDPATHGKGTVQSLIDLGDELMNVPNELGALKLTIQQFYLPDGRSTQREGVKSDIIIPALTASIDHAEADLDYAMPNDQVRASRHTRYNMVDGDMLVDLQAKSKERVTSSDSFGRLIKRIELFERQINEDYVSLDREDFLRRTEEIDAQREEEEQALESQLPKKEVFRMDFKNREILNIARDYVEAVGKRVLAQAG